MEPRIAPAAINAGDGPGGPSAWDNYTTPDTPFILAADSDDAVIAGLFAGSSDHYYLELSNKDELSVWTGPAGNLNPLIDVKSGLAYAFFYDFNTDGVVQSNELSGIMLSGGAKLDVTGTVFGDIITMLDSKTGDASLDVGDFKQKINGLNVGGSVGGTIDGNFVAGSILAGGNINKVDVTGQVRDMVGVGTAGDGYAFDFGGDSGFGQGTLDPVIADANKTAPGISNIELGGAQRIVAGDGGVRASGGNVVNITLINDTDGVMIQSGNGGDGASGNDKGGNGGKISKVVIYGVTDSVKGDLISIVGGDGGDGFGNGKGGNGGMVQKVFVGYEYDGNKIIKSQEFLGDFVEVVGGDGGDGNKGGKGGDLKDTNVRVAAPADILDPDEFEIHLVGGSGGDTTTSNGKGGNGGDIQNYFVLNNYAGGKFDPADPFSRVGIEGGDGGTTGNVGGHGGSVTNGVILSRVIDVAAGYGGDGDGKGGNGGSVQNLDIAFPGSSSLDQNNQAESGIANIFAESVRIDAGFGGNATTSGKGGNGGDLAKISAPDTNLFELEINQTETEVAPGDFRTAADGGFGAGGPGGNGGQLNSVDFDSDRSTALYEVEAKIRAGAGGVGDAKGGKGGNILSSEFLLSDASIELAAGDGGAADIDSGGAGGNGGDIKATTLAITGSAGGDLGTIMANAGVGGDSDGNKKAGNGGAIRNLSAAAWGDVDVRSGDGGEAEFGKGGNGGLIDTVVVASNDPDYDYTFKLERKYDPDEAIIPGINPDDYEIVELPTAPATSSATLIAGSGGGGVDSSKGGNGGSITRSNVEGLLDVTMQAGDGMVGGKGGDIKQSIAQAASFDIVFNYYTLNIDTLETFLDKSTSQIDFGIFGNVEVAAGDGGDGCNKGGNGGSLMDVTGYSSFQSGDAAFTAGNGAEGDNKGGNGGSINRLTIVDGNSAYDVIAGNGGDTASGNKGGNGGDISNVFGLPDSTLRALAAGNGGDALGGNKGGNGGSVKGVHVSGDIGFVADSVFGFDDAGGVFAGAGGEGAKADGKAGNVIDLTARAISSIVAGREASPELVSKVDRIYLRGNNSLEMSPDGSFYDVGNPDDPHNIFNANFIGGISDPFDTDASEFLANTGRLTDPVNPWNPDTDEPIDGLIAALVLTDKRNVAPNAWLQQDANGDLQLVSRFNE